MSEALRALGVLAEPPCVEHAAIAAALELPPLPTPDEHMAVLGFQLPPYASMYLGVEGMLGGEARDRIAGFWRALGTEPPREPDHLSVLCAAATVLAHADRTASSQDPGAHIAPARAGSADTTSQPAGSARVRRAEVEWRTGGDEIGVACAEPRPRAAASVACLATPALVDPEVSDPRVSTARGALYWEHIASWMPPYLAAVRRIGAPFHVAWADTLDAVLAAEGETVGPAQALPLALRVVPALSGVPADLDALVGIVLAPVRIGMVVARDDLARCAAALGLGLRAGERRFALRALLAQDAAAALRWLAGEARRQADACGDRSAIDRWWRARAHTGGSWLDERAAEAEVIAGQSG